MPDAYDDYLRALDDEAAREKDSRDTGPSFFTALLDASERATRRQIREKRRCGRCFYDGIAPSTAEHAMCEAEGGHRWTAGASPRTEAT